MGTVRKFTVILLGLLMGPGAVILTAQTAPTAFTVRDTDDMLQSVKIGRAHV